MIRLVFVAMAIVLCFGLCVSGEVSASSCGRAEVQAACSSYAHVPLRRGQIRRAERRARRAHNQALRRSHGSCGYAVVRAGCAGVSVVATPVEVHVAAPCCD